MNPDLWSRVKEVTADALERPAGERVDFLDHACASDAELRREVERLLHADSDAAGFLEEPLFPARPDRAHELTRTMPTVAPRDPDLEDDAGGEEQLPPAFVERIARRLRIVSLGFAIGYVVSYLVYEVIAHVIGDNPYIQSQHSREQVVAIVFIAISVAVSRIASSVRLSAGSLMDLGLAYQVIGSLGIGLATVRTIPTDSPFVWGVSWVCVWLVAYPVIVPSPWKRAVAASFLAGSMALVAVWIWAAVGVMAWPPYDAILFMLFPIYLCSAIGLVGANAVFRLGVDLGRAQSLGSYHLVSLLGRGGMGEVWVASHRMLARPAALKLVRSDILEGRGARAALERFHREARATAALTSPHTVNLYDYGVTDDGTFYYAMELLDGLDLDTLVRRHGPVPVERAVHLLRQCCWSLAEAHERGLVHRDIKPANVFACRQGRELDFVKILDFGLVQTRGRDGASSRVTDEMQIVGTPGFLAPEMALGTEPDARTDLYCLGCVAYWLVTGKLVFEEEAPLAMAMAHAQAEPAPPSARADGAIPPELDDLVLWCLKKDPSDRPASADELAERLGRIPVREAWTAERATRWWSAAH